MLNMKWLQKLSLESRILLMFGFVIYPRSSAQDCGEFSMSIEKGPEEMLKIIKDLQSKEENEKKCIADKEWTVFQRRVKGDVDFNRGWDEYVKGFGNCAGDYWLGLEELHEMTKEGNTELKINMITKDVTGTHWVAKYSNFRIGPASDKYRLHVSGYSGNATYDSLASHNNQQFSTKDADHDGLPARACASYREGGWWYNKCGQANLNGDFNKSYWKGIFWWYSSNLRYSEMKFRKRL